VSPLALCHGNVQAIRTHHTSLSKRLLSAPPSPYGTIFVAGSLQTPGSPLSVPRSRTHIFAPDVRPEMPVPTLGLGSTPRQLVGVNGSTPTCTSYDLAPRSFFQLAFNPSSFAPSLSD
jgi:hypothetical protein